MGEKELKKFVDCASAHLGITTYPQHEEYDRVGEQEGESTFMEAYADASFESQSKSGQIHN